MERKEDIARLFPRPPQLESFSFYQAVIVRYKRDMDETIVEKDLILPKEAGFTRIQMKLRKEKIREGEEYLNYEWPALPATWFMDYRRDGNRSRYENFHFARRQALDDVMLSLMTPCTPQLDGLGFIILQDEGTKKVKVEFDESKLEASSEYIIIEDARLMHVWGDHLHRVILRAKEPTAQAVWIMKVIQE